MRRYRKHIDDLDDGDDIVADGGHVRVKMDMMDGAQRDLVQHFDQQTVVRDQLAVHAATAGYRPGFCMDATSSAAVRDAAHGAGFSIERALTDRAAALDAVERRGANAWRMLKDAESTGKWQQGSGELGHPADPGEEDDDLGANGGATGAGDLAAAQKARDDAYQAAATRGDNAWRATEQQRQSWTAERPWRTGP